MDAALRNLVALGLALDEAVSRLSTLPAERAGLGDIGRIAPEARADLVVLDETLAVRRVFVDGREAF
jgi:N-acetylglucosamine-6-phosphate deacetylase